MSRPLSAAAKQAMFRPETSEAALLLLELDHDDLTVPVRVTSDNVDTVSNGNTYVAFDFRIDLPSEDPEEVARIRLEIDNVDKQIVDALKKVSGPIDATLSVVMASTPDTIEGGPFVMSMIKAEYDVLVVEGELAFEPVLDEPYPGELFTPASHPGLF